MSHALIRLALVKMFKLPVSFLCKQVQASQAVLESRNFKQENPSSFFYNKSTTDVWLFRVMNASQSIEDICFSFHVIHFSTI